MKQTNKEIQNLILKAYLEEVNKKVSRKALDIKLNLRQIIINAILNCPEMESVRSGILRVDFGLYFDPSTEIANAVSDSIEVSIKTFTNANNKINGGVSISVQPSNFSNLKIPASVIITEKGQELPWLDWLLLHGDSVIITNFGVSHREGGRSGGAIMIPNIRPFRVNPAFSGVESDNFISRALNKNMAEIENRIWQTILS